MTPQEDHSWLRSVLADLDTYAREKGVPDPLGAAISDAARIAAELFPETRDVEDARIKLVSDILRIKRQ